MKKSIIGISLVVLVAICSVFLASFIYSSIKEKNDEVNLVEEVEALVKEKLLIMRRFQLAYYQQKGKYAESWDELKTFVVEDEFLITVRKEEVIPLYYGADSIAVSYDTTGSIPVIDSLFSPKYRRSKFTGRPYNLDSLHIAPYTNKEFDFFAGVIGTNSIFEIVDAKPVNPERRSGEKPPLAIGSRVRVTSKGNWEK